MTPTWPLTSHICWSHPCIYPIIIVPKFHKNQSKYVDAVTDLTIKGQWPICTLHDRWPKKNWHHINAPTYMYHYTQVHNENPSKYVDAVTNTAFWLFDNYESAMTSHDHCMTFVPTYIGVTYMNQPMSMYASAMRIHQIMLMQ